MEKLMNLAIGLMQTGSELSNGKKSSEEVGEAGGFKDMLQQKTDAAEKQETVENTEIQETGEVEFDDRTLEDAKALLAAQLIPMNIVIVDAEEAETVMETAEALAPVVADMAEEPEKPEIADLPLPEMPETEAAESSVELPKAQAMETLDGGETLEIPKEQLVAAPLAKPVEDTSEAVETFVAHGAENSLEMPEETQQTLEERPEETLFSQTDAIPIKVAEPEAPAQTAEMESISAQLEAKLTTALEKGETKVVVQLTPENLGKVTVELARTEEGVVHVVLKAESAHTQSLLERHAANLQDALAGNGRSDVQVEIERRQESQNEQRQDLNDQQKNNDHNQRQQERKRRAQNTEDFLHQLRLGLVPTESIS